MSAPDAPAIRPARPDQVGEVRELTRRAYAEWLPVTPRPPRPVTADYDAAFREHRFDCLYVGDRLAGLVETVAQGDELLIVNVAVEPDLRGQGLGVRLVRHAEAAARAAGLRGTRLYTNRLMTRNVELYRHLGHAVEREEEVAPGTVAVHMTRPA